MNDLIDVVAKWKWMVGVVNNNQSEDDTAQELALLSTFIYNTYNSLKIDEINLAIQLSLSNKLDCDVNTYNSFSPLYVSRILNAYLEYKRKINSDITERKLIEDNKEMYNVEVTPKYKMESMIELIRYLYDDYKKTGIVNDYFNTLYNYFRRTNRLKPNKDIIDNAINYGKGESSKHINSYFADALKGEKPNKEYIEKRYSRNYCVQLYFSEIDDIEKLIATININEFL